MRAILFVLISIAALAANAQVPSSAINSTASGTYLGVDRVCRIVLSRWMTNWVQAEIRCQHFAGEQTASLTTVYAPGSCPQDLAYILNPWPPEVQREYISLRSHDAVNQTLRIIRGSDPNAVSNGVGTSELWYRIGTSSSPVPYNCSVPEVISPIDPTALARYCRQHPSVPACN